jgi:hypothetical protein
MYLGLESKQIVNSTEEKRNLKTQHGDRFQKKHDRVPTIAMPMLGVTIPLDFLGFCHFDSPIGFPR